LNNEMNSIKIHIYLLGIGLGILSCSSIDENVEIQTTSIETKKEKPKAVHIESDSFSKKATFSPEFGWGYQILNNDKLYINQPHIPSVEGNMGFKSKENALTTADYIIHKLENNIFPPTISPQELDSLNVL